MNIAEPSLLSRVPAVVCAAVLLCVGWTGCALPEDECAIGESRCVGEVVQSCKAHRGGIDSNSNKPGVGYHGSSPNTWEYLATCRSADVCKTGPNPYHPELNDALCVLESTAADACAGGSKPACEGTTSVTCESGYAVERQLCASCAGLRCTGGLHAGCSASTDCAVGLECQFDGADTGNCEKSCSCPDGAACDACRPVEDHADADYLFQWVCRSGVCFENYK